MEEQQQQVNWFDRLDLHTVVEILQFLDCKSLSKLCQTNVTMSILARMLTTRLPHWKTAHFEKEGETGSSKVSIEEYESKLNDIYSKTSSFSNVGFLFSETNGFIKKDVTALASKLHPKCCLIGGCSSAILSVDNVSISGENTIHETDHVEETKPRFSLSLSNMPDTTRVGFYLDPTEMQDEEDIPQALDSIPQNFDDETGGWRVIVLFVDHTSYNHCLDGFITAIQKKFTNAQVVGGIMGGTRKPLCIIQNQQAQIYDGGIVGMCIGGNTVFSSQISRGCQAISPLARVVDAITDRLKTVSVDGVKQSAASLAQECLGRGTMPFLGVSSDLSIGFTLHDIRGVTPQGELVLASNEVETAKYIQFFNMDAATSKSDLRHRLEAARRSCASQSKQVLGGLLFTCGGRGVQFYEEQDVESTIFAHAMPDIGLSGFFAGGEIGPEALAAAPAESEFRRGALIQGFTAVFGVFFVPTYSRPSGKILDEAIAARNLFF